MELLDQRFAEALAFPAPYVVDRLVANKVAAPALAEALFAEVKKYLVLCAATPETPFGMYSTMVDEAWHTFILFTDEYFDYGVRYFGQYLHHTGDHRAAATGDTASFDEFCWRYRQLFGDPPPEVWYDDSGISASSRVILGTALTPVADGRTVHLKDRAGSTILSVNELACDAVHFITQTPAFYVRELPGGLSSDEQVGLVRPLVRLGVLQLAP
jgi:hypothetical protein